MISEFLKTNTAHFHNSAEQLFNSNKIFNKTFTVEDYQKLIYHNYQMILHSENEIFNLLSENFSEKLQLNNRRKLQLIEKDFLSLGLVSNNDNTELNLNNMYEALGALYVIEGSTLGGNVMTKHLIKTEGFEQLSFHFFGCYQEQTGSMWKNFKDILDSEVEPSHYEEVLSGAQKLYSFLLNVK